MPNLEHETLANDPALVAGVGKVHGIVWQTVANAAALAALVIIATDVSQQRVVRQTDTGQLWVPTTIGAGATFQQLGAFTLAAGVLQSDGVTASFSALNLTTLARVSASPSANQFLKGNGAGVANSWANLLSSPVNPTDDGKLVKAQTGDFTYIGGASNGQIPVWGASGFAVGSPDFVAQTVTTTGSYVNNTATPILRLGLAPGSGAGSAAATGQIRGPRDFSVFVVANNNTTDVQFISWGASSALMTIGEAGMNLAYNVGTSHTFQVAGSGKVTVTSTNLNLFMANILWASGLAPLLTINVSTTVTNPLAITGQPTSGTNNVAGDVNITGGACTNVGATTAQTGGNVWLTGGVVSGSSGTRTPGSSGLKTTNGTIIVEVTQTLGGVVKMGFFAAAPVAKQALTNGTGVAAAANLVDVTTGGLADAAKVNANFSSIWACINNYGLWA